MNWFKKLKKRSKNVDPEALQIKADISLSITQGNQAKVSMLSTYLINRKNQNGFGDDFELSLVPKEAS